MAPSRKLLDQVSKLIALTSSPNENEARNAAYKACALIREYKLLVVAPRPENPAQATTGAARRHRGGPPVRSTTGFPFVDDIFDEVANGVGEAFRKVDLHVYSATGPGVCAYCLKPYPSGEQVAHSRKVKKTYHVRCSAEAVRAQGG